MGGPCAQWTNNHLLSRLTRNAAVIHFYCQFKNISILTHQTRIPITGIFSAIVRRIGNSSYIDRRYFLEYMMENYATMNYEVQISYVHLFAINMSDFIEIVPDKRLLVVLRHHFRVIEPFWASFFLLHAPTVYAWLYLMRGVVKTSFSMTNIFLRINKINKLKRKEEKRIPQKIVDKKQFKFCPTQ